MVFSTLEMRDDFVAAGHSDEQARAIVRVIERRHGEAATKTDIDGVRSELQASRREMEAQQQALGTLRQDVDTLRRDVDTPQHSVDALRRQMEQMELRLLGAIGQLRADMERLLWRGLAIMGGALLTAVGILIGAIAAFS